jgi:deoxycytidylate deaminase
MIKMGIKLTICRHRVVACGLDNNNNIISLATNTPRLQSRGYHAEERVIFSSPKSLRKILIIRVNKKGDLLPIHPCNNCFELAVKRNIDIIPVNMTYAKITIGYHVYRRTQ